MGLEADLAALINRAVDDYDLDTNGNTANTLVARVAARVAGAFQPVGWLDRSDFDEFWSLEQGRDIVGPDWVPVFVWQGAP